MNKEKSSAGVFGKVVSLVLSLMLIISMAAFPALAAAGDDSLFSYYEIDDGTIEISGYNGDTDTLTELVIPSEIDGKAVTTIGYEAFSGCTSLKSVIIPRSVTEIYGFAFSDCTSLESVTIPESVTEIGTCAFENCTSLKSVTIPKSVIYIESGAFSGCTSLESVTIPEGVRSIGMDAFFNCTSLESVTIPESVKYIDEGAFGYMIDDTFDEVKGIDGFKITGYKNSAAYAYARDNGFEFESLGEVNPIAYKELEDGTLEIVNYFGDDRDTMTDLVIPSEIDGKTVTSIGNNAFRNCTSLERVKIPEGVTKIGEDAFSGCKSLESVTIPEGVTEVGQDAFYNCISLKSVTIPKSVTSIDDRAFGYMIDDTFDEVKGIDGFKITGYKNSAAYAYARDNGFEFESLGEVSPFAYNEFEDGTLEIIDYFGDESDLVIPSEIDGKTVTTIGTYAFENCTSLESVTIPDGVNHIYPVAFIDCTSLKSVTIPESVRSIGMYAFLGCTSLKSVTIPKSVTYIESGAFGYFESEEGLYSKVAGFKIMGYAGTEAEAYANSNGFEFESLGEVSPELDPDVSPIAYNELEDGTLEIIGYSGDESDLVIPAKINGKKVTAIASEAFHFCDTLHSVTIPYGVTTIGEDAFYGCLFLESVTIPESVTSIGNSAFFDCWIKSVTIPKSVTSIGDRAFGYMIDDTFDEIKGIDGFKIMGYAGTEAEAYANSNGFEFVDLDNAPTEPTDEPATDTTDATEPTDEPATDTTDATEPTDEPATDATEQTDVSDTAAPGGNNNAGGNGGSTGNGSSVTVTQSTGSNSGATGKVATGDSMSVVMLIVLLMLSAAATAGCVSKKRRNG